MLASRLASSSRAVVRLAPFSQRFASGKPQGWELGQSLGSYLGFGLTKEYLSEVHKNAPPILQGPGTELGGTPSTYSDSTGLERYQLLGLMAGVDVFDEKPIQVDRLATVEDPILVNSQIDTRVIGCTGWPIDSHDLTWYTARAGQVTRCVECGQCYALKYFNPWSEVIPEIAEQAKDVELKSFDAGMGQEHH